MKKNSILDSIHNMGSSSVCQKTFGTNGVCFGLNIVHSLVMAQGCLLRISSKTEMGTDVIFSIQTRMSERDVPAVEAKQLLTDLVRMNVTIEDSDKSSLSLGDE
jgi:hypothetical protein